MRLKTDENLGLRVVDMLRQAGHDVRSVVDQGIQGAPDQNVIDLCHRENRGLVTMDLEFGNPLVFKPSDYSGIAILRLPRGSTPDDLSGVVHTLVIGLAQGEIGGKLWIVQRGRIRQYQEQDDN
jgi:predicted nuclease of predicted toxin-antitoxin system